MLLIVCQRSSGSRQVRVLQTALVLLRMGLEGSAPGSRCPLSESSADVCQKLVQLQEDRGVLKLINVFAPFCHRNSKDSIYQLQQLVDSGCIGAVEDLEKLAGSMVVCTRFVADVCNCMMLRHEDWDLARCSSLHSMLPFLESCLPTFDAALVLSGVVRRLQVILHLFSLHTLGACDACIDALT